METATKKRLRIVIPSEEQAEHDRLVETWSGSARKTSPPFYRRYQPFRTPPVLPTIVEEIVTNNNH